MSWFSHFVFDPILAAIAGASASKNKATQMVGQAASTAVKNVAADVTAAASQPLSNLSAAGLGNKVIGDLESGLQGVVDGFIMGTLGSNPIGIMLTPEAVALANISLAFAEQHVAAYVSALFSHAKSGVAAAAVPVASAATMKPIA